jgi:hypothetical protein
LLQELIISNKKYELCNMNIKKIPKQYKAMKTIIQTVLCLFFAGISAANAQNPIAPAGVYLADPQGRRWNDGKMYVYVSKDVDAGYYCSHIYDVLSSSDLKNWTVHPNTFASKGGNDQVPYTDAYLYAPDCIYKDGVYYLYYGMSGDNPEGVATGKSPVGPFENGEILKGCNQIDPAAFIDDDGQAYLYWGQFAAKVAKLKPNMKELDLSSLKDSIITEEEHSFHEGIQMFKRKGVYYLVYASIERHGMATCLGYATSTSPVGPFRYRGIIIDNFGCDPNVWNNQGSVVEFNGKWYVFYHRSTHGSVTMRKACIEPIAFNEDGTIDEVEMTTQGAAGPLDPFGQTDAERACFLTGKVRIQASSVDNEELARIENLNTAAYKYFDFRESPKKFTVKVIPENGGKLQVFANNLCAPLLCTVNIPAGDGKTAQLLSVDLNTDLKGVYPVYFRFLGEDDKDLYRVDWFKFEE